MEFFANFPAGTHFDPDSWAKSKEDEGWQGVCASDHFWVGPTGYPHVFVAATQMACATSKIKLTTSFCNNLFRSPVEFAQAALALQRASGDRFEAGLGAGWLQDEIEAVGETYPDGPTRISMYIEAMQIVRTLLHTGQCQFKGEHYQIDITGDLAIGPVSDTPPPLIGSVGGPRGLREVTPLVDRIEIKANARATRVGHIDFEIMSSVTAEEIRGNVERAQAAGPGTPIGTFIMVAVGDDPAIAGLKAGFGDGYLGRFLGEAEAVADALRELGEMGIDRVQLTEMFPGSQSALASHLF